MNKRTVYLWAMELLSQFIEGACDSFIVVAGGSTAAATPASGKTIISSVVIGGAIYVAAWLKKNPTPAHYVPPVDVALVVAPTAPIAPAAPASAPISQL